MTKGVHKSQQKFLIQISDWWSCIARSSHLYVACRSVCDCDQDFWSVKTVLDCSLLKCLIDFQIVAASSWTIFATTWLLGHPLLRLLIAWFSRVKGQIAAACSWFLIFSSSEVTLIPWSAPQKGFGCLIQFWSRSQTLLHGRYKWLPLVCSVLIKDKI